MVQFCLFFMVPHVSSLFDADYWNALMLCFLVLGCGCDLKSSLFSITVSTSVGLFILKNAWLPEDANHYSSVGLLLVVLAGDLNVHMMMTYVIGMQERLR